MGRVRLAVTGGLDLSAASADAGSARSVVAGALGTSPERLLLPRQVHSDRVVVADGPWCDGAPEADGVLLVGAPGGAGTVTGPRGGDAGTVLVAGVLAADCMPLLLVDPQRAVAAAVHVGRRGLHGGIVGVAVDAMVAAGARQLLAVPGPTVCGRCYEVPAQMRDEVAAAVPGAASTTRAGTPALDIPAGARGQLERASSRHGLPLRIDESWCACTVEDPRSFSHRRDAPTGRHAALVAVVAA
ncbi:polyphenol oxidase family protein [Aquipuribacter sp. MA13-6]|uniref:polyphenol oxidase family protein n=1 Tax=unclassified Aquipuribacter TaxID=2635084 RepID=UPI003EEF06BA